MKKRYTTLQEGKILGVVFKSGDPVPTGAIMQGDYKRLLGKVVRVKSGGTKTINLVTDVRYEEGETHLSFRSGRKA